MAKHVQVIPDCPECGNELRRITYYRKSPDKMDPFDVQVRFWVCTCGWESDHVGIDEWDELTYRLVLGLE